MIPATAREFTVSDGARRWILDGARFSFAGEDLLAWGWVCRDGMFVAGELTEITTTLGGEPKSLGIHRDRERMEAAEKEIAEKGLALLIDESVEEPA